jgi:hypothetical protein
MREALRRAVTFAASVVAAAVVVAGLNATWYGAPWRSGYGSNEELYSLASVWPNLLRYPVWLWQSQGALVLAALLPLLPWPCDRRTRTAILPAAALAVGILACYLPYFAFEDWWYLRFLLPGFGAFAVLMAAGFVAVVARMPRPWNILAAALTLLLVTTHTFRYSADKGIFGLLQSERRYIDMARYADQALPGNAVVFTMQHSGTVRFYGGRYSLRYDFLDSDWTDRAVPELEHSGFHPYLLIDDWEAPYVRRQFKLPEASALPWRLMAHMRENGGVSVYDMGSAAEIASPTSVSPDATAPRCLPRKALKIPSKQG